MRPVPYVDLESASGDLAELASAITALRGRVLNLHRALANAPDALSDFMTMSRRVRDRSTLPADLRELVVLMVATTFDNDYERHLHEPLALQAGVTAAQVEAITHWRTSSSFSPSQRAVLRFAEEATLRHRVTDEALVDVSAALPPQQIVELALAVGWYHLCHVVIDSLRVEREAL